jgi:uncharacterized protein YndB with AHSA1/START domain
MLPASLSVRVMISAPRERVFAFVADLARHGEWSADPLDIQPLSSSEIAVGSRYRSTAQSHGTVFHTELEVTGYEPPVYFEFQGKDATGQFRHLFIFQTHGVETQVTREIHFDATLAQWLLFLLVLYPVRIPSAKRTMQRLKGLMEAAA